MEAFTHNIFTFPTVFYSGLLVLVILYWISAMVGVVDIDSGDADLDADNDTG